MVNAGVWHAAWEVQRDKNDKVQAPLETGSGSHLNGLKDYNDEEKARKATNQTLACLCRLLINRFTSNLRAGLTRLPN